MFYKAKKYHSKYNNEEKKEVLRSAFEAIDLDVDYIHSNKTFSSFYFDYQGVNYRASLHHQSDWFKEQWAPNYDKEIVSNLYDNLAKRIIKLSEKTINN